MKDEIAEKAAEEILKLEERASAQNSNLYHPVWKQKVQDAIAEACRKRAIDELNNLLNVKRQTHYEKCNEVVIKAIDRLSTLTPKETKV